MSSEMAFSRPCLWKTNVVWLAVAFPWPPTSLSVLTSDPWHQRGNFLINAYHWIFIPFLGAFSGDLVKIPVDEQSVRYSRSPSSSCWHTCIGFLARDWLISLMCKQAIKHFTKSGGQWVRLSLFWKHNPLVPSVVVKKKNNGWEAENTWGN